MHTELFLGMNKEIELLEKTICKIISYLLDTRRTHAFEDCEFLKDISIKEGHHINQHYTKEKKEQLLTPAQREEIDYFDFHLRCCYSAIPNLRVTVVLKT